MKWPSYPVKFDLPGAFADRVGRIFCREVRLVANTPKIYRERVAQRIREARHVEQNPQARDLMRAAIETLNRKD